MIILGIETSCDETALSLLERIRDEYRVLGNIIHSQVDLHQEFGGVFPMLAKREHIKNLPILYKKILEEGGVSEDQIDAIAVTQGPGLEPALWTGITFAKELSQKLEVSLIPVNHMEGHIFVTLLNEISKEFKPLKLLEFPSVALLVSGGHTEIVKINNIGEYEILGKTVDDAVGEAFDKVARMLNLPYPGGPEISKLGEEARQNNTPRKVKFPRPMIHSKDLKFSFSGLKTAVLYHLKEKGEISDDEKKDIAREFEDSVTEVLISKMENVLENYECKNLIIGGGVIANKHIREEFEKLAHKYNLPLYLPLKGLSGDNALMIALVGAIKANLKAEKLPSGSFSASGNLSL
jgi:N6-L-threonylcarbamoyladenine synthase